MKKLLFLLLILGASTLYAEPSYVVLNTMAETISTGAWMNAPTNDIVTIGSMPNQITNNGADGIYVVCSGNSTIQEFTVTSTSAHLENEYDLPSGSNPYLMYKKGNYLYTTLWVTGGIGIIDESTTTVVTTDSFCLGPQGIFVNDEHIFVTAGNLNPITFVYGPGQVWRLSLEGEPIDYLEVGTNPQEIIEGPDGNLHIVCTGDYFSIWGKVYIVDPELFTVVDSISLGGSPQRLSCDPETGVIYSATSVWGLEGSGRILAYDGNSHEVIWSADYTDNATQGIGLTGLVAWNNYIIVPSMDSSFVEFLQVDGTSLTQIAKYRTGYGPLDVTLFNFTGIEEQSVISNDFMITAYPNPFNSKCFIAAPPNARIKILDLNGKIVQFLYNNNSFWEPGAEVTSGTYFLYINSNNERCCRKIVYLK
ncbi:T9SS type A sorting domain-containing protein [bacterium]|nr:T9SS type A sorting domain-containing protein [bacterium]